MILSGYKALPTSPLKITNYNDVNNRIFYCLKNYHEKKRGQNLPA